MLRRSVAGLGVTLAVAGGVAAAAPGSTEPPTTMVVTSMAVDGSSTSAGPTTTLDPVAAEEAAAARAASEARAARMALLVMPNDPALVAALDTLYTANGDARAEIADRIASIAEQGLSVVPDPDVPDGLTVEDVVMSGGRPATAATVTACVVESGIYSQSSAPETSEVLIGSEVRAFRAAIAMVAEDGMWKVDSIVTTAEWPGEATCPPPPATTTTTLDPVAAEEALVAQRVHEIEEVRSNAYINPNAEGTPEALDGIYAENGPGRVLVDEDLQALAENGWRVREGAVPSSLTVEDIRLDGWPATRAEVRVCLVDATVLYEPGGAPDGSDAVVNDEVIAFRAMEHLVIEDHVWQIFEVEELAQWSGAESCPPD